MPPPLPPPSRSGATPASTQEEDPGLDELPPLDGDASEVPAAEADFGEGAGVDAVEDRLGLDDATAEDEPVDAAELAFGEDAAELDGAADAPDLDVGDPSLSLFTAETESQPPEDDRPRAEAGPAWGEETAFAEGDDLGSDVGEEGPLGDDESVSESALPDLDADERGTPEDVPAALAIDDEPSGLGWAAEPWARVGAPWPVAEATAVAIAGAGALVVGRGQGQAFELLTLDLEGACQSLRAAGLDPTRIRGLLVDRGTILATASDGRVFFSSDGGASFVPADDHAGEAASRGPQAGRAPRFPAEAPSAVPAGPFTARGSLVAYAARRGGVVRGGKSLAWSHVPWDGRVTDLVFIDDAGTLVAATYSDAEDVSALVRVSAGGEAVLAARIGPARSTAESDGRIMAMAFDDARGVLWVAGGFGIAAFAAR